MEILRKRAHMFLESSKDLLERGFYDLVVFNLEQYCRLILRYRLLIEIGKYPRTYSLIELVKALSEIKPKVRVLLEKEEYLTMLRILEDAYVAARYLPRMYMEDEAKAVFRFVIEVFKEIVEGVEDDLEYAKRVENLLRDVKERLKSVKREILKYVSNARIYLFGSLARGDYTACSDIDILVVVEDLKSIDKCKIKILIEDMFPELPLEIHVVDKETLERWYMRFIRREELIEV